MKMGFSFHISFILEVLTEQTHPILSSFLSNMLLFMFNMNSQRMFISIMFFD